MTVNKDAKRADHISAADVKAKYLFEGAWCLYIAHNNDQRAPGGHYQIGACIWREQRLPGPEECPKMGLGGSFLAGARVSFSIWLARKHVFLPGGGHDLYDQCLVVLEQFQAVGYMITHSRIIVCLTRSERV
jgi:hypothetical protein